MRYVLSQRTDPWRFSGRMGWQLREHWRKSSQWFALSRKHAQLVLEDTHVLDLFQRFCQNAWDNDLNRCVHHPRCHLFPLWAIGFEECYRSQNVPACSPIHNPREVIGDLWYHVDRKTPFEFCADSNQRRD